MKKLFLIGLILGLLTNGNSFSQGVSSDERSALNAAAPKQQEQINHTEATPVNFNVHCNINSDFLILEVYGLKKMELFEIKNQSGTTVYAGGLIQTQIIETSTWQSGIYYLYMGNKVERFVVSK